MNDMTPTSAERAEKLEGMGCRRKRVEDIRFTQGKGNYVDDLKLPGMLYGDFTRSPHAHARVVKIDTAKAAALPVFCAGSAQRTWLLTLFRHSIWWCPGRPASARSLHDQARCSLPTYRPARPPQRRAPGESQAAQAAGQRA